MPPAFSYWRDSPPDTYGPVPYARDRRPGIGGDRAAQLGRIGDADLVRPADARRRYLSKATLARRLERPGRLDAGRDRRRRRGTVGLLEAARRPVAPGGPGLLPPGRKPPQRGVPLRLSGDLRAERVIRLPHPISAAQPGLAGAGRRQEQGGPGAAAVAGRRRPRKRAPW